MGFVQFFSSLFGSTSFPIIDSVFSLSLLRVSINDVIFRIEIYFMPKYIALKVQTLANATTRLFAFLYASQEYNQ
jgi:hypothetical protein